jgi:WD40 repeat protein
MTQSPVKTRLVIWDAKTGKKLRQVMAHEGFVFSLAFSPDGQIVALTGSHDDMVSLWDVELAKKLFTLPCGSGEVA